MPSDLTTTPTELLEESLSLLTRTLTEACQRAPANDLHVAFVYRHARNISDLGDDVLALEIQNRTSAARIVVRPMLESLFRLVAAVQQPSFAVEKIIAETEDEVERIEKWIKVDEAEGFQSEMGETTNLLTTYAQQLRAKHSVTSKNRWSVYDTARVAGLDWHYARDYFLFSKYVHATISGIISQEQQASRGHVLRAATFVVLAAVGHFVQVVETETPQTHVDEAARLLELAVALTEKGAFRDGDLSERDDKE